MENKEIKCQECGSQEFITQPNQYDVYEVIEGELQRTDTICIDDEFILYCRDCSKPLDFDVQDIA